MAVIINRVLRALNVRQTQLLPGIITIREKTDNTQSKPYGNPKRVYYTDWRMLKDAKRRRIVLEYAVARQRLNCIRKNKTLPKAIQECADAEIDAFPRDSNQHRLTHRCGVTSRAKYVFKKWRLSRFIFRHLSDYNYLSGVQRALW